ncbi:KPN_02809 family neutral zinc metallopeptidase [Elongatibacter sediminis]|uniref:Neutral zinc metallopeptidase n=1 Tax=Elongatibacter sediminis TaxID=3119006 RepID=A0AAW9RAC0_9GAMM
MKWKGRRGSDRVVDARGRSGGRGGSAAGTVLSLVGRKFGIKGIIVMAIVGVVLWQTGLIDPAQLVGGPSGPSATSSGPVRQSESERERFEFVRVVLADTEDIWTARFAANNEQYRLPELVTYRGSLSTGCGFGRAEMGPFYCPADQRIYIDLSFYDELEKAFSAPGDFAQAYVIAHEIGHHVQTLLGASQKVHARRGQDDYNEWSVRLELQADCYAGVWAHHNRHYLERGDIEEAVRAANAIGDDAIQQRTQGRVVPHAFTHGTSAQRQYWFEKGLNNGSMDSCDTFSMPYQAL